MDHLQSCLQVHLNLACVKLTDTEEELRTTKEKCMKLELMNVLRAEQITKLEQRVSSLENRGCLLYTSPSPRDQRGSRMPSSA